MGYCRQASVLVAILAIIAPTVWNYRDQRQFNYRTNADEAALTPADFSRKVAIVTGSSAGIGIETARVLLERGASVVMACRSLTKANRVRTDIISAATSKTGKEQQHFEDRLTVMELDLASMASIRSFADQFRKKYSSLDFLVLNAGLNTAEYSETVDGHESHFGVNHLGHAMLTELLLPDFQKVSAGGQNIARVVVVASWAHHFAPTSLTDWLEKDSLIQDPAMFNSMRMYGLSKAMNILYARELNVRHSASGVYAVSLHPGTIHTELVREAPRIFQWVWKEVFGKTTFKSVSQGAATTIRVLSLSDDEFKRDSGLYFSDCNVAENELRSDLFPTGVAEQDMPQKLLWDLTERILSKYRV